MLRAVKLQYPHWVLWKVWSSRVLTWTPYKCFSHSLMLIPSYPLQFIETTSSKIHLKEITSVYHNLSSEKCPTWTRPAPKAIKFPLKWWNNDSEKRSPHDKKMWKKPMKRKRLWPLSIQGVTNLCRIFDFENLKPLPVTFFEKLLFLLCQPGLGAELSEPCWGREPAGVRGII